MEEKLRNQNIQRLDITDSTIQLLNKNNISTLEELCQNRKSDLKRIGLSQEQINQIEIQLQLEALNLRSSI